MFVIYAVGYSITVILHVTVQSRWWLCLGVDLLFPLWFMLLYVKCMRLLLQYFIYCSIFL